MPICVIGDRFHGGTSAGHLRTLLPLRINPLEMSLFQHVHYPMTSLRLLLLCFASAISCMMVTAGEPGWRYLSPLPEPRVGHGSVMVQTGDVLVFGGINAAGTVLGTSYVLNGATGAMQPTATMDATPRTNSAVVVVPAPAGQVFVYVIGGYTGTTGNYASSAVVSRLRFDAVQGTWQWEQVGLLPVAVGDCRAVYDGIGTIVVSGGYSQTTGALGSGNRSAASAAITIASGTIRRLADHTTARAEHGLYRFIDQTNAAVVMAAGGEASAPTSTELLAGTTWDPRANAPLVLRKNHVPLSDISGTARALGGESGGVPVATCEWYDPKSGWRNAPRMNDARADFDATLIAGPTDTALAYLTVAGRGTSGVLASCEVFLLPGATDPAGSWTYFNTLNSAASGRKTAMTSSNLPVVVAGNNTATVECFQPLRAPDVQFPATEVGARSDSVPITVINTWMLPIVIKSVTILDGADFIIAADTATLTLAGGQTRVLLGWFRPSQPGLRKSRVVLNMGIVSDTITLSGNGLASTVSVVTSVMDHGDVAVKTQSRICLPLLRNNGTDTTWIDSIVVDPPGAYIIESPKGKAAVAPGEELVVCVIFAPERRGQVSGTAMLHIGPRSYPVAVLGNGIRTAAVIRPGVCDTVSAQRTDVVRGTAILENIGDRDVTVTALDVLPSVPGSAQLADPTIVPFTLRPNELRPIDIELIVQREGEERIQLVATSNSDTTMLGTVCIVVRARNIVPSISQINVGDMCIGDTVRTTVTLTNASAVETITITDVIVENTSQAVVSPTGAAVIPPRSSYSLSAVVGAAQSGLIGGSIVINTTRGSSVIPVVGRVLDAVVITMPDAVLAPAEVRRLPLGITPSTAPSISLELLHSPDIIAITGIETNAGGANVDGTSSVQRHINGTRINIVWAGAPPTMQTTVDLVIEALRGSDVVTDITAVRAGSNEACVVSDTASLYVDPNCGQERSLVKVGKGANVSVSPMPTSSVAHITVAAVDRTGLEVCIVDCNGSRVYGAPVTSASFMLDVSSLATGMYAVHLLSSNGLEDNCLLIVHH